MTTKGRHESLHVFTGSSLMPIECPVCKSVGTEAFMHEHIMLEHPERVAGIERSGRSHRLDNAARITVLLTDG